MKNDLLLYTLDESEHIQSITQNLLLLKKDIDNQSI